MSETNSDACHSRSLSAVEGLVESVSKGILSGWVWDRRAPDDILAVEVAGPAGLYTRAIADNFRDDLLVAGKRQGWCQFLAPLPSYYSETPAERLVVLIDGTGHRLRHVSDQNHEPIEDWLDHQSAEVRPSLFVQRCCYDIHGRIPTEAELAAWLPFASKDFHGLTTLVRSIALSKSDEAACDRRMDVEDIIQNVYRGVLGREADPQGIADQSEMLRNGMPLAEMIANFVQSPEFLMKAGPISVNNGNATELRQLAGAMERAMLTLAIGAAGQGGGWPADIRHVVSATQPADAVTEAGLPAPPVFVAKELSTAPNGSRPMRRAVAR